MACLVKITGSQLLGCGPTVAQLARPVSAKLINASQIESYTVKDRAATITRAAGTPAAASLECAGGATKITVGVKGGEVTPQAADVTITTKMFNTGARSSNDGDLALSTAGANSRVVIAVDHGNGIYRVYGLGYPLECLNIEGDSEGDGFITTTFGVEDWQPGTTIFEMSGKDYAELSTPVGAVTPPSGGTTPPSGGATPPSGGATPPSGEG